MSIAGFVVCLIIVGLVGLWVAAPWLRRSARAVQPDVQTAKQRERLLTHYERILTNIRDLDEDHATGKMNTGDYGVERETWVQRGIQVLQTLDEMGELAPTEVTLTTYDSDDAVEAVIAAYRSKSNP